MKTKDIVEKLIKLNPNEIILEIFDNHQKEHIVNIEDCGEKYQNPDDLPSSFFSINKKKTIITYIPHHIFTNQRCIYIGPHTDYTSSFWTNEPIPDSSTPNNVISPLWDDWKAGGTTYNGEIY